MLLFLWFKQLLIEIFIFAVMIYLAGWAAIAHTLEEKLAGTQRLSQNATRCNKETIQEINLWKKGKLNEKMKCCSALGFLDALASLETTQVSQSVSQ